MVLWMFEAEGCSFGCSLDILRMFLWVFLGCSFWKSDEEMDEIGVIEARSVCVMRRTLPFVSSENSLTRPISVVKNAVFTWCWRWL